MDKNNYKKKLEKEKTKLESSADDYTHYDLNSINNNPNFYSEYTKDLIDKKNRR